MKSWFNTYHNPELDRVEDEFYYLVSQGTGYWVKLFSDELKEGDIMEKFLLTIKYYLLTSLNKFILLIIQPFLNIFLYFVSIKFLAPLSAVSDYKGLYRFMKYIYV